MAKLILLLCLMFYLPSLTNAEWVDKRIEKKWQLKRQDVLGVGQALFDVVAIIEDDRLLQKYLDKFKMKKREGRLINKKELMWLLKELKSTTKFAGGSVSNTIAGLASLGSKVGLLSILGDDAMGKNYTDTLRKFGVRDFFRLITNDTDETGQVVILVDKQGDRTMLAYPGVSKNLEYGDINNRVLADYKVVFVDGYMWDAPNNPEILKEMFKSAKTANTHTAFTFGDSYIVKNYRASFLKLIKEIDIVFSDEAQILELYQAKTIEETLPLVQKNDNITIITLGAKGSYIVTPKEAIHIPAHKITNIVDLTGAGDQYAAGFLYGYVHGYSLSKCGKIATAAAAEIIQQQGGKPVRNMSEVLANELSLKE